MTKTEIKILSKRITSLKSKYKEYWKDLQEQIHVREAMYLDAMLDLF